MTPIEIIAAAALEYVALNLPPFPLHPIVGDRCGCGDRACTQVGKHPCTKGWPRSTASAAAAAATWKPDARVERGIGIALGERARAWVLDIDRAHDGFASLRALVAEHGELPPTWKVRTGGGGGHLWWAWPEDGEPIRNSAGKIAPGLDVRGAGGFVVAAPSLHASGRRYQWVAQPGIAPALAPDWLVQAARAASAKRSPVSGERNGAQREELVLRAGDRYDQLIRFAGVLRSIGLGEPALVDCGLALLRHHAVDNDPTRPIDLEHAERMLRDVARRYPPDGWRERREDTAESAALRAGARALIEQARGGAAA